MNDLRLSRISKSFARPGRSPCFAVREVCLELPAGSCTGLIGESGSGKSTLARIASLAIRADSGQIALGGQVLSGLPEKAQRPYRGRIQRVHQDPRSSLNPRHRIRRILAEPLRRLQLCPARDVPARAGLLLQKVGLDRAALERFPGSFSGGECQRIAIARALACDPDVLIADEPTAALDVAVQAQLMNLLLHLQQSLGLTLLMISHDLALVSNLCDRIGVMERGRLVELAETTELMNEPVHPATRMLVELVCKRPPTVARPVNL